MRRGEIEYAKVGEHHVAYREYVGDANGDHEIVMVNGAFWPMESLTDDPIANRLVEGLAGLGRLILFDRRGIALSDPITDWESSLRDQWADDLAGVIRAADCSRPTVFSWHNIAVARACAVRHAGLIGRLVLFNATTPITEADEHWVAEWIESTRRMRDGDLGPDGDSLIPNRGADPSFRAWNDAAGRAGASPSQARRLFDRSLAEAPFDDSLVTTPTLVIARSPTDFMIPSEYFRRGAETIPGAELVDLGDGDALAVGYGVDDIVVAISEHLTGEAQLPAADRHLAAILFTDLVDSTRRAVEAGDADWKRLLDRHDAVIRSEIGRRGGEIVKTTGDGVLALLPSATAAVEGTRHLRDRLAADDLEIRVGIHVGEVDRRGQDVSGLAVNIAARVMAIAEPSQILMTDIAARLAGSVPCTTIGSHELRGVGDSWELFAVDGDAPGSTTELRPHVA